VWSLTQSPEAVTHSPAEMMAAWPMIVIRSRCPRALILRRHTRLDPQNAEATVGIVKSDALNKAGEHFLGRGFLVVLHCSCLGCPSV
jgi:hypothetical protein